jgi:hypothetical protein
MSGSYLNFAMRCRPVLDPALIAIVFRYEPAKALHCPRDARRAPAARWGAFRPHSPTPQAPLGQNSPAAVSGPVRGNIGTGRGRNLDLPDSPTERSRKAPLTKESAAIRDELHPASRAGLELIQAVSGLESGAPLQIHVGIAIGVVTRTKPLRW